MNIVTYEGLAFYHDKAKTYFVGNNSFDAYKQQTAELIAGINAEIEKLTGLDGSNFLGIFENASELVSALPEGQLAGWVLVGTDLTTLHLHTTNTGNEGWHEWEQTYDFTDFSEVKASLAGLSLSTPMSEDEWDTLTDEGKSAANLKPNTIYLVYEE